MKLAIVLTLPFVLLFAMVSSMSFLVVDVRESGPDANHIVVPVPLALAQFALAFVPQEHTRVRIPDEAREYLPLAEKALDELAKAPDCELVRVEAPGENVLIAKHGDLLLIEVHDHNDDVSVKVPFSLAKDILRDTHGDLRPADIVYRLRQLGRTDLVDVRNGHDHVKISIW